MDLSLSLDDMIKKSGPAKGKGSGRGGGGRGAGAGRGGAIKRGGVARSARQSATPYKKPAKVGGSTLSSMASNSNAAKKNAALKQSGGLTTGGGAKIKVANLDAGVTTGDIQELFGEIGKLKSAEVVTNQAGASKGFAMVTYLKKADAQKAIETYNGVPLDGKPLKITLSGGGAGGADSVRVVAGGGERKVVVRGGGGKGAGRGAGRGAGSERGRGRGKGKGGAGGRGRGKKEELTAEQMDADLDSWKTSGGD